MKNIQLLFTIIFHILLIDYTVIFTQDSPDIDPWKIDLQILLGFRGEKVDGIMGETTFDSLKIFADKHDLTDVVLRGYYNDLGYWGFQQYLIKYNQYWLRELKNNNIIDDVLNKEYLRQADETLYSYEIALQNAQLEVERLTRAKSKAKRSAKEKDAMDEWEVEKVEAERLINGLKAKILVAEKETEKWSLERLRARRLREEQEQLQRLIERKEEALILTAELEDVINLSKSQIDILIVENENLKNLIIESAETNSLSKKLKNELNIVRLQLDSLSIQKDSLEKKLLQIQQDNAVNKLMQAKGDSIKNTNNQKKKWYNYIWFIGKR